jgi:hypothetical protein
MDCAEPRALARFWAVALGYIERPPPAGFAGWEAWFAQQGVPEAEWDDGAYLSDPEGVLPNLSFLKVPEGRCYGEVIRQCPGWSTPKAASVSVGSDLPGRSGLRTRAVVREGKLG